MHRSHSLPTTIVAWRMVRRKHLFHVTDIDIPTYTIDVTLFDKGGLVSFNNFRIVAYCGGK
jgi:hypothetical protein